MNRLTGKDKNNRIHLLDIIRGILIIYVVYYHFMYDLNDILGHEIPYLYSDWFSIVRDCMSGSLIFISGISCNFSRSNLKRGVKTVAIALLLSVVTIAVMPSQTIIFGILHLLGTMMVIYGLCGYISGKKAVKREAFDKEKVYGRLIWMLVFLFMFVVCRDIYDGYIQLMYRRIPMPGFLYGGKNIFLYIMGFSQKLFSADYYPVIPWGFLFLSGAMGGYILKSKKLPGFLYKNFCRPLAFIGRHTMIIYLAHQPVLFGVFMLIDKFF